MSKGNELAYDMDRQPEAYSEIRDGGGELISLKAISPNSEIVEHEFADHPNPLEAEAKEYQTNISDNKFSMEIADPISMISTWCMDVSERVTERGTEWWDDHISYVPLDWVLRSRWRRATFALMLAVPSLVWLGADLAEVGFRIDVWEQEVSVSREALGGFVLLTYVMDNTLGDEWAEIEDGLIQFVNAL